MSEKIRFFEGWQILLVPILVLKYIVIVIAWLSYVSVTLKIKMYDQNTFLVQIKRKVMS